MTPAVAAVSLLVVLLSWLTLRASNTEAEHFDRMFGEMDRLAMREAALETDVLSARAGTLRNYDPLVREENAIEATLDRMRRMASGEDETIAAIDRLAISVDRQAALIEQFKTNNALLQNSLAYFGMFSRLLSMPDETGAFVPAVGTLAAAMLRLTLDTSSATADEVQDRLEELARLPLSGGDAASVQALLAHGSLLHELLPATDGIVKALWVVPRKSDQDALRTLVLKQQAASRASARWFRLLLYVTSLVLVGVLVQLGLQLRARARALRRRAAFEHVIAGISMRFVSAQPQDTYTLIEQALAELAECVGADRAYFLIADPSARTYSWSRQGGGFPPGWPERAPDLMARFKPTLAGIIHVPRVERLPPGEGRDACVALRLKGWACASSVASQGKVAMLGFDALQRPCRITRPGELGLMRMALDTIVNALGRQSVEEEKAHLESRLQQARRMESVGALTSGIAHNFNNIIGAILGYTEMAEEQVPSGSRPARNLGEIRRAGERARDLIDEILRFGRRRETRRQRLHMQELVAETASLLRASLPAGIELEVQNAAPSALLIAERAQLQQVILNLCNNAAQAMDGAGCVALGIDVEEVARPRPLSHGTLARGRYVVIAVSDAGRGMDDATLGRLFEPFFTTRVAGNGLGLATVRDIVREHGGAMNVSSAPGAGSRFEAWLPCASGTAAASGGALPAPSEGAGETVLLIEHEREELLRDEEILAALGYEPVGFTRAEDALQACREAPLRFDMLVLGPLMSTAAVLELAGALHTSAPDLPLVLAAPSADDADADALAATGISDVVRWPIITAEIAAALDRCSAMRRRKGMAQRETDRAPYANGRTTAVARL
jgi:signal transduction histidine kinase/FixJ family two-component response regulator